MYRKPNPTDKKLAPSSSSPLVAGVSGGCGDHSNAHFLRELETLTRALALEPNPKTRRFSLPSNPNPKPEPKPRSSYSWSWRKPLKALTHLRHPRRFDCTFTLRVHSIESLPQTFSNSSFVVHWRRASDSSGAKTRPIRASHGLAEFEETLSCRCSVYGGEANNMARYEPRQFLIYVTLAGATGFDFGKHRVELTRILPVTMEELEGHGSAGEWSTSFRLAGKARGALLNVSFGYSIGGGDKFQFKRSGSVKGVSFSGGKRVMLREVIMQELDAGGSKSGSEGFETKCCTLKEPVKENEEELEFTVIEQGVEIESKDWIDELRLENVEVERANEGISLMIDELRLEKIELDKENDGDDVVDQEPGKEMFLPKYLDMERIKKIDLPILELEGLESPKFEKICTHIDLVNCENRLENVELERENDRDNASGQEPIKEDLLSGDLLQKDLDLEDNSLPILELEGFESPGIEFEKIRSKNALELIGLESPIIEFGQIKLKDFDLEGLESPKFDFEQISSNYKARGMRSKSLSLDDESVANEFLSMLGLETSSGCDPESPREQLWKQFQKENLNADDIIFGPEIHGDISEFNMERGKECLMMNGKPRAKMLEDAETEALMREWGLNEKVSASCQPVSNGAFGSPIHLPPEEPLNPPPLDENLGPFLQTKDGGFLRSMNPSLFKGSKNCGSLVMQTSRPVVVLAEMGSDFMVGIEKLPLQASKLMPLEDITS